MNAADSKLILKLEPAATLQSLFLFLLNAARPTQVAQGTRTLDSETGRSFRSSTITLGDC